MEQIDKNTNLERLRLRAKTADPIDHHYLWLTVSFSLIRDNHLSKMGARALAVFLVLRTHMNKNKIAFPKLSTIAKLSHCNICTVQKEVSKLVKIGWIEKVGRLPSTNGTYGAMQYRIIHHDLIRGTGDKSFIEEPVIKNRKGLPSSP